MASRLEAITDHMPFLHIPELERYKAARKTLQAFDRGEMILSGGDFAIIQHDLNEGQFFESITHPRRPLRHALSTLTVGVIEIAKYAAIVGGTIGGTVVTMRFLGN